MTFGGEWEPKVVRRPLLPFRLKLDTRGVDRGQHRRSGDVETWYTASQEPRPIRTGETPENSWNEVLCLPGNVV